MTDFNISMSSADPEELMRYEKLSDGLNRRLDYEARQLSAALRTFASTCTEYSTGIGPQLADDLQKYVQRIDLVDQWVGQVRLGFQYADQPGDVGLSFEEASALGVPYKGQRGAVGSALAFANAAELAKGIDAAYLGPVTSPALQRDFLKAQGLTDEEIDRQIWLYNLKQKPLVREKPELLPELARMRAQGGWSVLTIFDGKQVILVDPDGNVLASYPAESGKDGVTDTGVRDKGPIPEGTYTIEPKEISHVTGLAYVRRNYTPFYGGDWGNYRVPLRPDSETDTKGRDEFFLHGGNWAGTKGCIDVRQNDNLVFPVLEGAPPGAPLKVLVIYD